MIKNSKLYISLIFILLLSACSIFTAHGRAFGRAEKAEKKGDYYQAVLECVKSLQVKRQFDKPLLLMDDVFPKAVKFYNQLEELPPNSVLETCWCFSNSIYVNMTYLYNREHEENIYVVDTEFFRMFGGRGTDGNPSSPEIWKERITSAEKEGKLFTVETDTFLDGKIKPTTAQNVFDKYIESDFYKDSINASSS